jgi:TetR/AcrR family transcriptional repressor of nem operon
VSALTHSLDHAGCYDASEVTDLVRGADKRERLIDSARTLIHQQGVHTTTLAEVAGHAKVPAGNVYYYFKTKEDLVRAVVDDYVGQATSILEELDRLRTPASRLKGLTRSWLQVADTVADHGCPVGSLCAELNKCDGPLRDAGAEILGRITDWSEAQFRQLGHRDAPDLAMALISGIQGSALLANTFRDATIMSRQTRHMEKWIDSLA